MRARGAGNYMCVAKNDDLKREVKLEDGIATWGNECREKFKAEDSIAAYWLINYRERKRNHDEKRQEIVAGIKERDENIGGGRSSIPGRPTEAMALKIEEHDNNNAAKWLKVVEIAKQMITPKKRQLLELRQECRFYISPDGGRPGWIAPVQQRFGETTGWCPSNDTVKTYWRDIVIATVRIAQAMNVDFKK